MITNIVEAIQKNLGYPSLQKVNPNSQEVKDDVGRSSSEKLAQSAITSVLTVLVKFTRNDKGANDILSGEREQNWLKLIFEAKESEAVEKVAHYSNANADEAAEHMQKIAKEAIKLIHESVGNKPTTEKIKTYMKGQRHNILLYLPAAMQLGFLLNDDSLDDRTNKMEGPISNLMHSIENKFSGGGS